MVVRGRAGACGSNLNPLAQHVQVPPEEHGVGAQRRGAGRAGQGPHLREKLVGRAAGAGGLGSGAEHGGAAEADARRDKVLAGGAHAVRGREARRVHGHGGRGGRLALVLPVLAREAQRAAAQRGARRVLPERRVIAPDEARAHGRARGHDLGVVAQRAREGVAQRGQHALAEQRAVNHLVHDEA